MPPVARRTVLRTAALSPLVMGAAPAGSPVTVVIDLKTAAASPVRLAVAELQAALTAAGHKLVRATAVTEASPASPCIVVSDHLVDMPIKAPSAPESVVLFETKLAGRKAVVASGSDARGISYAVYELADRVRCGEPLSFPAPIRETPANAVRSVMRQFASETYDKPWFYDREMWPHYFAMLAANRFNRFDFTFGLTYDQLRRVADPYLLFTYPFLIAVPGFDVKVTNLPDAERDRNLKALRYISDLAVSYGLEFQIGLWMHGYDCIDTPNPKYSITGLNRNNHAAYCREAMTTLLNAVPAISSVSMRIHGESGVAEGSQAFWKGIFEGIAKTGRKIELDLHAKGTDAGQLASALGTGLPVTISTKYAAEHIGLPYHQADIRFSEIPAKGPIGRLLPPVEGTRLFTRYGYADVLTNERPYKVRNRVFHGTQRILASGSAEAAAAHARAFQFCGMIGADIMEPLTFRGRRGSVVPGERRSAYLPKSLEPKYDWQKYDAWYRSFGRTMYNPETDRDVFTRGFPGKSRHLATALERASLILPLVVQAHSESAACDLYCPEMYWNMPMDGAAPAIYFDSPEPRTFQNVTPLDPQLFSSCREFAGELLGARSGKYSPVDVAQWLNRLATETEAALTAAGKPGSTEAVRLALDAEIQALLGRFFAAKLRAGVLAALNEQKTDRKYLSGCIDQYRVARTAWATIVERTHGIYGDLSISDRFAERGTWADRLRDIDVDIGALEGQLAITWKMSDNPPGLGEVLNGKPRASVAVTHTPPARFTPKADVTLAFSTAQPLARAVLWYRHVNHAERWISVAMTADGATWRATIPDAYADGAYPLQYYFTLHEPSGDAALHPGIGETLLNQPYFVVPRG